MPCQGLLGPSNRMAAGSVLWILAMVDGSQQAKAPGLYHLLPSEHHHIPDEQPSTCSDCAESLKHYIKTVFLTAEWDS